MGYGRIACTYKRERKKNYISIIKNTNAQCEAVRTFNIHVYLQTFSVSLSLSLSLVLFFFPQFYQVYHTPRLKVLL